MSPFIEHCPWSFTVHRGRRGRPPLRKDKSASAVERPSSKGATNDAKRPLSSPTPDTPTKRKRIGSSRGRTGIRSTQRVRRSSHTPVSPCIVSVSGQMLDDFCRFLILSRRVSGCWWNHHLHQSWVRSRPARFLLLETDFLTASDDKLVHDELVQSSSPRSRRRGRRSRPQEPTAPQTLTGKAGRKGAKETNTPIPTADNEERNPKPRRGRRKTNGEETTQDTEEVLELLESTSAPVDSVVFQSGSSSVEIPLQDKASAPSTAESSKLANHTDVDGPKLPDREEIQPSPSNITFG